MPFFIVEEHVQLRDREPEQAQEHRRGERLGQRRGELAGAVGDEAVDELVDQLRDVRLDQVHPLGGEDRIEQLAVLRVLRRVDLQRDQRHRLPEVDRLHGRGEDLGVLEGELDFGPAHDLEPTERARDDGTDGAGLL